MTKNLRRKIIKIQNQTGVNKYQARRMAEKELQNEN